jgi:hypothetical protein
VPIAATTGESPFQEGSRVYAHNAAVRIFNVLCREKGWQDFARVIARTRAGDGYGNVGVSQIAA